MATGSGRLSSRLGLAEPESTELAAGVALPSAERPGHPVQVSFRIPDSRGIAIQTFGLLLPLGCQLRGSIVVSPRCYQRDWVVDIPASLPWPLVPFSPLPCQDQTT